MGPTDLDDIREGSGFALEGGMQMRERRNQPAADLLDRRDMHGGGKAVIRGLAQVDVIVGVDRSLRAQLPAQ